MAVGAKRSRKANVSRRGDRVKTVEPLRGRGSEEENLKCSELRYARGRRGGAASSQTILDTVSYLVAELPRAQPSEAAPSDALARADDRAADVRDRDHGRARVAGPIN